MPEHSRRRSTSNEVEPTLAPANTTPTTESNAALAEDVQGAGLANYEATLGSWLGGELYGAVAPHLTLEGLSGHAESGLNAALQALVKGLGDQADTVDEAALDKFAEALAARYDDLASDWMKENGSGLQGALAGWVDAHPKTIVGVGLLAAAGAVLANVSLPELKTKMNLSEGLSLKLGAKLGKVRDIALEKVKAQLEWKSGPLVAAMKVEGNADSQAGELSARYGSEAAGVEGRVRVTDQGLETYGLYGLYKPTDHLTTRGGVEAGAGGNPRVMAEVGFNDGSLSSTTSVRYQPDNGSLLIQGDVQKQLDALRMGANASVDENGLRSAGVNGTYTSDSRTLAGSAQWNRDNTSLSARWDEHWTDRTSTRLQQDVQLGRDQRFETTGLVNHEVDEGVSIFGGGSWRDDAQGSRFIPEVGMQIDNVPISIKYDTATEAVSVGFRIRF